MKKSLILLLPLMLMLTARAVTKDEALSTAQMLTGANAVLIDSEEEDGVYEFAFDGGSVRYDVDVLAMNGAVLEFETTYKGVPAAEEFTLSETGAESIALERYPGSTFDYLVSERDDGSAVYEVFIRTENGAPVAVTLSAEDGALVRTQLYPAATGVLPASEIARIAEVKSEGERIGSLELSYGDRGYDYEGSAGRFDFEIDAVSGNIKEWEADD